LWHLSYLFTSSVIPPRSTRENLVNSFVKLKIIRLMKKINAMLNNPKVQGNLLIGAISITLVLVVVLTWGK